MVNGGLWYGADSPYAHGSNWKFQLGDLDDRSRWDTYTEAYRDTLRHTSTKWAPWFVVPADDKKIRNLLVAQRIADTLEGLDLRYPAPDPAIKGVEVV